MTNQPQPRTATLSKTTSLTASATLHNVHREPISMREAIALIDSDGWLTTTLALDVDTFVEMRSDNDAFDTDTDIYTVLAGMQIEGGDAYDASYNVVFFDPETNLIYVEFTTGLSEHLMSRFDVDLLDEEDTEAFLADFEAGTAATVDEMLR